MRPVIFLDIDDVLAINPEYSGLDVASSFKTKLGMAPVDLWIKLFSPNAVLNIHALHMEFSPEYVITSSWTNYLGQLQIQSVFEKTGLDFVGENLHRQWTTPKSTITGRLIELQTWIARYGNESQPILIIDDTESGWNLEKSEFDRDGKVVLCEPRIGFVEHQLAKARQILHMQTHADAIAQK